jgi:hypothetical protein
MEGKLEGTYDETTTPPREVDHASVAPRAYELDFSLRPLVQGRVVCSANVTRGRDIGLSGQPSHAFGMLPLGLSPSRSSNFTDRLFKRSSPRLTPDRLNDIDPQAYLRHMLTHIADHPIKRIDELLPWNVGS